MKRYLLLVFLCLMAVSCDQDTNFYVTPDVSTFEFGPDGGEFDDVIFTNGSWTCEVSDDAVTVTPSSGDYTTSVHVVVAPNTERYTKAIRLKFISTYGDLSRNSNVVVTQDQMVYAGTRMICLSFENGNEEYRSLVTKRRQYEDRYRFFIL